MEGSNHTSSFLRKVWRQSTYLIWYFALLSPSSAQESAATDSKTMLDPAPWVSPRANGMAGALSSSSENMDAFYYNPASIGGNSYTGSSEKQPFVRQVFFPRAGLTINENAVKLNNDFTASSAQQHAAAGAAVIKTHDGKRQYARASMSPLGLFLGRFGVAPVMDQQLAAVPKNTDNSDVEFRYRTFSGLLVGGSLSDPKSYLSLGASTSVGTIEETHTTAPYVDMVDVEKRKEILSANKSTYAARGVNVGGLIRLPNKANPTLAVVARDMGNTKNSPSRGDTPLITQEDLTIGFGLAPAIGKVSRLKFSLEAGYLTDKHQAAGKKLRGGVEWTFGRQEDSRALLGLRAGGNSAGASFGAHLNLGLIGIEASSHAVDIGINNERLIERRNSAVVFVDVASF